MKQQAQDYIIDSSSFCLRFRAPISTLLTQSLLPTSPLAAFKKYSCSLRVIVAEGGLH